MQLSQKTVTLAHLNVRPEKHGDENLGGADLGEQVSRLYEVMGGEIDITVTPAIEKQGQLGV